MFNLGNGYKLTIMEDHVYGKGYGSGSLADDNKMNTFVWGVDTSREFTINGTKCEYAGA